MASFLAFAWRRGNASNTERRDSPARPDNLTRGLQQPPNSPLPPAISASHSGDTLIGAAAHHHMDIEQDSSKEHYIRVPHRRFPSTPEGLRPRLAASLLRNDLGLPAPTAEDASYHPQARGVLPSASWSTQGVLSSPPVSTNSFYARGDGNDEIAESPHLLPGQARTAVGAVVASQQEMMPSWPKASNKVPVVQESEQPPLKPLPDRTDWKYDGTPPKHRRRRNDDEDSINENNEAHQYYSLDQDPVVNSRTPLGMADNSPISTSSSLVGSPSSRAYYPSRKRTKDNNNTSFTSRDGLIHTKQQLQGTCYDFGPLVVPDRGNELVVVEPSDHVVNLSAMSHSVPIQETQADNYANDDDDEYLSDFPQLDGPLRRCKSANQRQAKELLVLLAMERLQDDLQVISDVEEVCGAAVGVDDWFLRTDLQQEGLLTGLSKEKRDRLDKCLSKVLDEMKLAQPEEFFMSPTQIPEFCEEHDDLRNALEFCRRLVKRAIPSEEKQEDRERWKLVADVRSSLGIIPPESPEVVRGGDTSLFSLPSDTAETPMTSNVSLTTTITSAVTPPHRRRPKNPKMINGLVVRRTIEIFSTLMQRMSLSCLEMLGEGSEEWVLGVEDSIRVTETIKRTYLQFLAMEQCDMKTLVESFQVEDVYADQIRALSSRFVIPPPTAMLRSYLRTTSSVNGSANSSFCSQVSSSHQQTIPTQVRREISEGTDLFSPSTEDMRSYNPASEDDQNNDMDEDGFDDLRRQVGSNDYEDEVEMRDGPPEEHREGVTHKDARSGYHDLRYAYNF